MSALSQAAEMLGKTSRHFHATWVWDVIRQNHASGRTGHEQEVRTLKEQVKWEMLGPGRLTPKRQARAQRLTEDPSKSDPLKCHK